MTTILDEIVANKRQELAEAQARVSLATLQEAAAGAPVPLDLAATLRQPGVRLIAEVKRASPSKGALNLGVDPVEQALIYARGGAAAISVLTESRYFKGSLEDLKAVKSAVRAVGCDLPVLRKDFVVDPYQVYEARAWGADALLLIAASLPAEELAALLDLSRSLGMECLVEVHDQPQLEVAVQAGARVIGINNRDLRTFAVDVQTTGRLLPFVPPGAIVVSESGLLGRRDVELVRSWGVQAILVGEALMISGDPATKLRELQCCE